MLAILSWLWYILSMQYLVATLIALIVGNVAILNIAASEPVEPYSYFSDCEGYAKEVYCETNSARISEKLPLLKYSDELEEVSRLKSEDMCKNNYFSHDYNGRRWTYFIKSIGIDYKKAGENLAKGYQTAPEALQALLNSPSHYDNIMGDYTHIGVYTASCGGKNYTTQTFAKL